MPRRRRQSSTLHNGLVVHIGRYQGRFGFADGVAQPHQVLAQQPALLQGRLLGF
jgi:hypothetical protein